MANQQVLEVSHSSVRELIAHVLWYLNIGLGCIRYMQRSEDVDTFAEQQGSVMQSIGSRSKSEETDL
jgi:hypothetical protein